MAVVKSTVTVPELVNAKAAPAPLVALVAEAVLMVRVVVDYRRALVPPKNTTPPSLREVAVLIVVLSSVNVDKPEVLDK